MNALANGKAARRLENFKRLLAHIRDLLSLDFGFVLWDGSTVPADLPSNALSIVFADEGVVAAILRRPNADTFLNLWITARIDIRNGVIFDFLARQPKLRTKEIRKRLGKRLALTTALKFLFVPRGGPWPLETIRDHEARTNGSEATNKENIHYHYDLSNAFYALFLDPEMVYSCAYFRDWNNDLATAQHDKLEMICRKLRLTPGDRLLDIGCGWGALVCHAAKHFGVNAVGVTLAEEQFAYAKEKVASLGLEDKVTIELRDYSLIEGDFDKIASIGMFEHVGVANHHEYFKTINRLLKPGGFYLHHSIALRSAAFERQPKKKPQATNAIGRYIFPGGELDHLGMSIANLERHGFEVHDVEAWREHYARTTRLWHDSLSAKREAAEREVGTVKTRLWTAYLAAASIGFARNSIGIFQTLASKRVRGPSGLPPSREQLYH
ncbi:MAG: cyclopropane-fatty-acyl-phospholipid synthase family protein [Casimicrobiaceae bacterium]